VPVAKAAKPTNQTQTGLESKSLQTGISAS